MEDPQSPFGVLITMAVSPRSSFGLMGTDFPRELAEFSSFIGGTEVASCIQKFEQKLHGMRPEIRGLYGDRFYFHEQLAKYTYGSSQLQIDLSSLNSVRAASLIAGINRISRGLTAGGAMRLRKMVLGALRVDRDIRQIEQEVRAATHFSQEGFKVIFADLIGVGNFDLLLERETQRIEIECKTITEDTGSQIKVDLNVNLFETFIRAVHRPNVATESGLYIMILKKPVDQCDNLSSKLRLRLESGDALVDDNTEFSLSFSPRPSWQKLFEEHRSSDLRDQILTDHDIEQDSRYVTKVGGQIVGLVVRPHKKSVLNKRVIQILKNGADQCSRKNPSALWLHFVGMREGDFKRLAEFSADGKGRGLNAIVADALGPKASSTDRSHVQRVLFSADPENLRRRTALRPDLLLAPAVSSVGIVYHVPNPFSRFSSAGEI